MSSDPDDLNVVSVKFNMSSMYLEMHVKGKVAKRHRPWLSVYILLCIMKKVKIREESILHNIIPFKSGMGWFEHFGSGVVTIQSHSYSN